MHRTIVYMKETVTRGRDTEDICNGRGFAKTSRRVGLCFFWRKGRTKKVLTGERATSVSIKYTSGARKEGVTIGAVR